MAEQTFTPAYSDDDKAKVTRITAWLAAEPQRTGAELCKLSNIKDGTRSSILNGSYISSPTKFLDRMLDVIERDTERHEAKVDIPYTKTSVAHTVIEVCRRTHMDRDFGIFTGRVGVGKTTALREYAQRKKNAVLVECFEGIDHGVFVSELTSAMGVPATSGSIAAQTARLINNLKGSDRIILVDEANHLSARSLGALRRISDVGRIGVVLVGTPQLLEMVQDSQGRFGQISSRIGYWPAIAMVITEEDARNLTTSYFGEPLPEALVQAFYSCCEGSGRALRNLLRGVYRYANGQPALISAELINEASADAMAGRYMKTKG